MKRKQVAIEYEAEQAPENEKVPEGELSQFRRDKFCNISERGKSEIEHIESVTTTSITVDRKKTRKRSNTKKS